MTAPTQHKPKLTFDPAKSYTAHFIADSEADERAIYNSMSLRTGKRYSLSNPKPTVSGKLASAYLSTESGFKALILIGANCNHLLKKYSWIIEQKDNTNG